jgi:hypothetical protein
MKLDNATIKYLNNAVSVAQLVGIDDMIIEPGLVRAMDDAKTVIILQNEDVPDMLFGTIGLNRLSTYKTRYDVAHTQDNFTMDAVTDDNGEFVRSIAMKGKGIKIDYRCANPTTITAPKALKDEANYELALNGEGVMMFQKGMGAMGSENVTIICNDGVFFEFADDNNDTFKYQFADDVKELVAGADAKFVHKYPAKVLLALFKNDSSASFTIGKQGTLSVSVNGLNVTVLPKV